MKTREKGKDANKRMGDADGYHDAHSLKLILVLIDKYQGFMNTFFLFATAHKV